MDCQKHLFSLPDDHHYLNCAYQSPLMQSVEKAGIEGIKQKNRPWRITPDHFFTDSNQLRSLFAELINAEKSESVAIMPAASYGLATVAQNVDPQRGNKIIIAGEQFPSNVYIWKRFCKKHNCELEIVSAPQDFEDRGKRWNKRILRAVDDDTLLVALGNIHWADGTLFDLKTIGEKARQANAYFVIDGTQSVGALPFDVQQIKPDALICAGYKWLMGPYSIALGYFAPHLQEGTPLEEGWIVRKNSEDFSGLVDFEEEYQPGAQRYDVGERSNFILVPMMIKALRQLLEWDPANIQEYCKNLTTDLIQQLPDYGYKIESPDWRAHHMFGIRMPQNVTQQELQHRLEKNNIYVSLRGSAVRISPNVYNDERDIAALLELLKTVNNKK